MTGVSPFLYFHKHTIITIKDATIMSQSITSMDARTQLKEERINIEIDEQLEAEKESKILIEQWWKQDKDVPTYPEPEGDPSY